MRRRDHHHELRPAVSSGKQICTPGNPSERKFKIRPRPPPAINRLGRSVICVCTCMCLRVLRKKQRDREGEEETGGEERDSAEPGARAPPICLGLSGCDKFHRNAHIVTTRRSSPVVTCTRMITGSNPAADSLYECQRNCGYGLHTITAEHRSTGPFIFCGPQNVSG